MEFDGLLVVRLRVLLLNSMPPLRGRAAWRRRRTSGMVGWLSPSSSLATSLLSRTAWVLSVRSVKCSRGVGVAALESASFASCLR